MISKEQLSDIHAQLRRQMNADIASTLARTGVRYHLCFGVPSMRLREVAERYEPSAELAEALWHEDIRESKMLATRLYPIDRMSRATAERWVAEVPYTEVADQLCMHLLSRLPYAVQMADEWLSLDAHTEPMRCYCALMIRARRDDAPLSADLRERLQALADDTTLGVALRTAAHSILGS